MLMQFSIMSDIIQFKMWRNLFFLILLSFFCTNKCEIINTNVVRTINIRSQLVEMDNIITIKNLDLNPIKRFIYVIDPDVHDFYIRFKDENNNQLICREIDDKKSYEVFLGQRLSLNNTYIIKAEVVYIDKIVPLYKKLTFVQDQFVSYKGNLLYYSPYETVTLKTIYLTEMDEDMVLSHTPNHYQGNILTFFNKTLKAYSFEQIEIQFKNNNPFLVVHNLERLIDVSHFGKTYIEDKVTIKNEGSKLVGPYEQKKADIEIAASGWWYTHLPPAAEDVKYFDVIGNNSKSHLSPFLNYNILRFRPRYPLLNGWKTFYIIQYSVPTYQYLFHDMKGYFSLKIRIVDHVLSSIIIRNVSTTVLLPEFAEIIKVHIPYGFTRLEDGKRYTDLSTFGRPTLFFTGSNILENHIDSFTTEYLFSTHYLIRAPLMIILYLEGLFVFFILVSHSK